MKEIPLSKGYVALVDDVDYDRVISAGPWHAVVCNRGVYAKHSEYLGSGRQIAIPMHRFILQIENPKIQVDHRDHNGLNNQRTNLRICTRRRNNRNRRPPRTTSTGEIPTSSYKGVCRDRQRWRALLRREGASFHCGCFTSEIDAALAYDQKAEELFGDFAWLNREYFPEVMAAYQAGSQDTALV